MTAPSILRMENIFISIRCAPGSMQIWRMHPDGSAQEQVTSDDLNNWFPHISPDGKWLVFLSYGKEVEGHPENKDVMLRIMPLKDGRIDGKIEVLAKLFGGQGTINVPSWSPDSKQLAFVSYELIPKEMANATMDGSANASSGLSTTKPKWVKRLFSDSARVGCAKMPSRNVV